jgi:hypothetical protein
MEVLRGLCRSGRTLPPIVTLLVPHRMRSVRRFGLVVVLCALVSFPSIAIAQENYTASEFIEENVQNQMSSADIIALLNQTAGMSRVQVERSTSLCAKGFS